VGPGERLPRAFAAIAVTVSWSLTAVGCGSEAAAPAGLTRSPTVAPSAGPTIGGSLGPTPTRDPGQVALTKFFALATDDGFAYQATFTGKSRHTVDVLPITNGILQVNGRDVRVRATFTFKDGARIAVEHRSVAGKGWIRFGTSGWLGMTRFGPADSMAAFAAVHGPPDVTYLGPVTTGGKTAYRITMPSVIVNPIMIPASNLTERVITSSRLELLVDAAGRPLSGKASIDGQGRVSGQLQEIVIDLNLTFVKVGQKVTIAAP
jgi:hypothetical protein